MLRAMIILDLDVSEGVEISQIAPFITLLERPGDHINIYLGPDRDRGRVKVLKRRIEWLHEPPEEISGSYDGDSEETSQVCTGDGDASQLPGSQEPGAYRNPVRGSRSASRSKGRYG